MAGVVPYLLWSSLLALKFLMPWTPVRPLLLNFFPDSLLRSLRQTTGNCDCHCPGQLSLFFRFMISIRVSVHVSIQRFNSCFRFVLFSHGFAS